MGFVSDITVRVHGPDGTTQAVDTPPDVETRKFIDQLRESFRLGSSTEWCLYIHQKERLDPRKSLAQNGVRAGDELHLGKAEKSVEDTGSDRGSDSEKQDRHSTGGKVLVRCDNAHYYDPKKYKTCPYCEELGRKG